MPFTPTHVLAIVPVAYLARGFSRSRPWPSEVCSFASRPRGYAGSRYSPQAARPSQPSGPGLPPALQGRAIRKQSLHQTWIRDHLKGPDPLPGSGPCSRLATGSGQALRPRVFTVDKARSGLYSMITLSLMRPWRGPRLSGPRARMATSGTWPSMASPRTKLNTSWQPNRERRKRIVRPTHRLWLHGGRPVSRRGVRTDRRHHGVPDYRLRR